PNVKADAAAWASQQTLLKKLSQNISDMHTAVNEVRRIKKSIEQYNELLKEKPGNEDLLLAGKTLITKLDAWEQNIVEVRIKNGQDVINWPSKLNAELFNLKRLADAHEPVVTEGVKTRATDLENEWLTYKEQLNTGLRKDVDAYNTMFKNKNLPALMMKSGEMKTM
ncbi:MAG: glycosyl hydrolase, partial [Bacteroidota bacterium]